MHRLLYIFHNKYIWLVWVFLALCATALVFHYFPQANSLVTLNITMNRYQADIAAQELAKTYGWGPHHYHSAIIFDLDEEVRNFVELEAGGQKAFEQMLDKHLYEPYTWQVRHFFPHDAHETTIIFTPDGKPYGFKETLSATSVGAAMSVAAAREIAATSATNWSVNLALYKLIETSSKTEESGRIDHIFTYEQRDETIGAGRYRLQLVVSGDRLTTLKHTVYIPESFVRRYHEMRSANEGIARIAVVCMWFFYFFICCIIGIFFLLRIGFVLFTPALWWALGLAFLMSLSSLNYIPLLFFSSYNTALSLYNFIASQIVQFFATFIEICVDKSKIKNAVFCIKIFQEKVSFNNLGATFMDSVCGRAKNTTSHFLTVSSISSLWQTRVVRFKNSGKI